MMALTQNENIRKDISNFYTHQRKIKAWIKGKELIQLGLKPGPVFTKIIHQIIDEKLDGRLKTKKEEIEYAREYALTNKLID